MPDTSTTPSQALAAVRQYFLNLDADRAAFRDWCGGNPTGGPNGDGNYPLTDFTGNVHMTPCPAKIIVLGAPNGSGAALTAVAAEAIPRGYPINVYYDGATARARKADADYSDRRCNGFALADITYGSMATVAQYGVTGALAFVAFAADVFLASGGGVSVVAPAWPSQIIQRLGVGIPGQGLSYEIGEITVISDPNG
ncbi:hypothetical protein [Novosphingobium sp. FKTRR1]|uniref:hypothetical protein n=1 Tax=Novosphingobium sp. FKTRR1 TaxID=2879118 RepID=UPI001CEFD549|nr:hypothetical protein [Novosphingobium sp. FKTRR1]